MISSERVSSVLRGHGELRAQAASEWAGPIPLPAALERYYLEVGPADVTIPDLEDAFFLPALADLWDFQAGYCFDDSSEEALSEWPDDWLVVAEQGGNPLVFSQRTGRVSLAQHDTGAWVPVELFTDLNEMACCLSLLGSIIVEKEDALLDEASDGALQYRRAAEFGLTDLLGTVDRASHVLRRLGWGSE